MKSSWHPPPSFSCPTPHGIYLDTDFHAQLLSLSGLSSKSHPELLYRMNVLLSCLHECPVSLLHSRPQWTTWVKMCSCMPWALQRPTQCVCRIKVPFPATIPGLLTISRYPFTDFPLSTTVSIFSLVTDSSYSEMWSRCFYRNSNGNTPFDLSDKRHSVFPCLLFQTLGNKVFFKSLHGTF